MMSILDLIPQRPPIVMVDSFLGLENGRSSTQFLITEENIFVDDHILSECGVIEHIAQSAAARVGFIFQNNGEQIPIGYIGSVNNFQLYVLPQVGNRLETNIEIIQEVFNISLIEAVCMVGDVKIASCRMKIYLDK